MAGDPSIGRMRDMLLREAGGDNQTQADAWRYLQAAFTAIADALNRHMSALEDGWPRTNTAASAFYAHVDNLVEPVQGQAVIAAADNANAVANIEAAAKSALSSINAAYAQSAVINQRWNKLATQSTTSDATEIGLMKQQTANFNTASRIVEGYKTEVAQTPMAAPPTYTPPFPVRKWGPSDGQSGTSGGGGSVAQRKSGGSSTQAAGSHSNGGGPGLTGALPVALPAPPVTAPPATTAPPPTSGPLVPPVIAPSAPPIGDGPGAIPGRPGNTWGMPSTGRTGGTPSTIGQTPTGRGAPSVIGDMPRETGPGGRSPAPGISPSVVGGKPPVTGTAGEPASSMRPNTIGGPAGGVGGRPSSRAGSTGAGVGDTGRTSRSAGEISARVRGLGSRGSASGVRGVLDDPASSRTGVQGGRAQRGHLREPDDVSGSEYESDDLWTVPRGAPTVLEPEDDPYNDDPGPAIGR